MKKLISLFLIVAIVSCKKNSSSTTNTNPNPPNSKTEYFSYDMSGTSFSIPIGSVNKDLTVGNGVQGFYIGESTRNLFIDAEVKGSFVINFPYNSNNLPIKIGINNNDPNRKNDTLFDYATLEINYEDGTWIEGTFSANNCVVQDLSTGQKTSINMTVTNGKFNFMK